MNSTLRRRRARVLVADLAFADIAAGANAAEFEADPDLYAAVCVELEKLWRGGGKQPYTRGQQE